MSMQDKYGKQTTLTLDETAAELGVTVSDVESIIGEGELKVKKIGSKTIVPVIALESYLDKDSLEELSVQSYHTELNSDLGIDIRDAEEGDLNMIRLLGQGSIYFNQRRNCWDGAFFSIDNEGVKKRKIFSGKSQMDVAEKFRRFGVEDTSEIPTIRSNDNHLVTAVLDELMKSKVNHCAATQDWYVNLGKKYGYSCQIQTLRTWIGLLFRSSSTT